MSGLGENPLPTSSQLPQDRLLTGLPTSTTNDAGQRQDRMLTGLRQFVSRHPITLTKQTSPEASSSQRETSKSSCEETRDRSRSPLPLRGSTSGKTQGLITSSSPDPCRLKLRVNVTRLGPDTLSKYHSPVREVSGITTGVPVSESCSFFPLVRRLHFECESAKTSTGHKSPLIPVSSQFGKNIERSKGSPAPHQSSPARSEGRKDTEKPKGSLSPCQTLAMPPGSRRGMNEQRAGRKEEEENEEDFLDDDHSLNLSVEMDRAQCRHSSSSSSSSSEEEQLLSLEQILEGTTGPPDTPPRGAYSLPGTPVQPRPRFKPLSVLSKVPDYSNILDAMLKEKARNERSKEIEMSLKVFCAENLLELQEEEHNDENTLDDNLNKQKEFELEQRFSRTSTAAIKDVHPGEEVFCLSHFGRLFDQDSLKLRQCHASKSRLAQEAVQKASSPDQLAFRISSGFFQDAYYSSPCPPLLSQWLFQMMSVHTEMIVTHHISKALHDMACFAAQRRVVDKDPRFKVWVPSIGDMALVFMNMGAPYVKLFPLATLQPSFTEGDLLDSVQVNTESLASMKELCHFPMHNYESVIKYLEHVTALCPRVYSDTELLMLMTLVSKAGLDTHISLDVSWSMTLHNLLHHLVDNMRDWDNMLPRICATFADLTEDHHNRCWLVKLMPQGERGLQLRRHLSVVMISTLLDQRCTYTPTSTEFQLSALRPFLRRMRPSTLLKNLQSSKDKREEMDVDDAATPDQQAYYLCNSLLTLLNEASNFEFFPPEQKDQLLFLCSDLEKYIKCDIRENKNLLYRSKVKDFVARIYTKWQILQQKTRPLQGHIYDFWIPCAEDMMSEEEEAEGDEEGGEAYMEVEEEEN